VIVGASCRFAAESATRAGWQVYAADLFGDRDLVAAVAAAARVERYPDGLVEAAAAFPAAPWCYTGAVENHPHVIERLTTARPLAGNSLAVLRHVRDPAALASVVGAAGLRVPDTRRSPAGLPTDGSYLQKPIASAGGRGIGAWRVQGGGAQGFVWQQWISGEPLSAVLALAGTSGRLVGVSRQLVGSPWCRAAPFAYAGSVRLPPAAVPAAVGEGFAALARALARLGGLAGIVGADAILEPDGRLTVIEVNPRPTASAELCERATGASMMATHLAAFGYESAQPLHDGIDTIWSKAILFAAGPVAIDAGLLARLDALATPWTRADGRPALADIPRSGQTIRAHAPMITVFARGHSGEESTAELQRRVAAVQALTG
jgi:uncharacterized protein